MRNNIGSFIVFAVMVLGLIALLSAFCITVIRKGFPIPYLWIPFVIFPVIFVTSFVIGNLYIYTRLGSLLYTISVFWVPVLLLLCVGLCAIGIVSFFPVSQLVIKILIIILAVSIGSALAYGYFNARNPKSYTYTIEAKKLHDHWSDKKIVLVSDIHIGMVLGKHWMEKAVAMINAEHPDIVFIAGDLIDGPLFPYQEFLSPLKSIKSTFGVYYAAGNHDEYNREQTNYYTELEKYVTVLNDKTTTINETQIIGLIYAEETASQTKDRLTQAGYMPDGLPSIVLLHNPKNSPAMAESGVTLTLSGHTHGGQFFPFTLIVNSMYKNLAKGIHYMDTMAHVTSVGFGTAGPILRLGTKPEIAVIKIK